MDSQQKYAFHFNLICFLAHPYNPTNTRFACKDMRKTERPSWKVGREHFHHPHVVERENHGLRANPYILSSPYLSRFTYHWEEPNDKSKKTRWLTVGCINMWTLILDKERTQLNQLLALEGSSILHNLGLEGLCYDHVLQLFTTKDSDGGVGRDFFWESRCQWKLH